MSLCLEIILTVWDIQNTGDLSITEYALCLNLNDVLENTFILTYEDNNHNKIAEVNYCD